MSLVIVVFDPESVASRIDIFIHSDPVSYDVDIALYLCFLESQKNSC